MLIRGMQPDPDPAPAPAGEGGLDQKIAADASAANAAAQANLSTQIQDLQEKLLGATGALGNAAERIAEASRGAITPPVAASALTEDQFAAAIDEAVAAKGGNVSAGVIKALKDVLPGIAAGQFSQGATVNRALATNDPTLKDGKGVPLMTRFDKEIRSYIKERGITDQYLAQFGYGDIVAHVAQRDAGYQAERKQAVIDEYKAAQDKLRTAAPGVVTGGEGVNVGGNVAPPAAQLTEDQQIAAIEVPKQQEALLTKRYGLTKSDIQRQKFEMRQMEAIHGAEGLRQLGGMPVVSLDVMTMDAGVPGGRAPRKVEWKEERQ